MNGKISADLLALERPIGDVRPDPENAMRHPRENIAAIMQSLSDFGQRTPIVANASGIIEKGNGTWAAAKELGWETIAVSFVDDDRQTAIEYAIADNRSSQLSRFDPEKLKAQVAGMRETLKEKLWPSAKLQQIVAEAQERVKQASMGQEEDEDEEAGEGMGEWGEEDSPSPAAPTRATREDLTYHISFDMTFEDSILVQRAVTEWEKGGQDRNAFIVQLAEIYLNGL